MDWLCVDKDGRVWVVSDEEKELLELTKDIAFCSPYKGEPI